VIPKQPDIGAQLAAEQDPILNELMRRLSRRVERLGQTIGAQDVDVRDMLTRAITASIRAVCTSAVVKPLDCLEALAAVQGQIIAVQIAPAARTLASTLMLEQVARSINQFDMMETPEQPEAKAS